MNKDYADLENSKQKKSWVIIKISIPVFDLENSDLSALTCSRDLHFSPNVLLEIFTVPTAGFAETAT